MSSLTTPNSQKQSFGLWILLLKVGTKLIPILTKLMKVLPKIIKGALGLKTAGAVASLGFYSLIFSWQMGISLVAFILIHEFGHLLAMKGCGIKTKGIYLIPGFGGAAMAAESFKSARNEMYIAIMGPLYGLLFIIPAILLYFLTQNPIFAAIASIMSLINLFNLFPINPLDGGRIMKSLLYSLRESLGFFFMLFSLIVAAFAGWYLGMGLLILISIIGFFELMNDYGLEEVLPKFKATFLRAMGIFIIFIMASPIKRNAINHSWISFTIGLLCVGGITAAFIYDMWQRAKIDRVPFYFYLYVYPFRVCIDAFAGIAELFRIKPCHLKRIDQFAPMAKKEVAFYTFAYIVTIIIMIALILYTDNIPGAHLAKELLT
ncbi:MAG: hypothetical protein Q7R73_00850 [bacterium]|nr:hypothetical protein [bacterium]